MACVGDDVGMPLAVPPSKFCLILSKVCFGEQLENTVNSSFLGCNVKKNADSSVLLKLLSKNV